MSDNTFIMADKDTKQILLFSAPTRYIEEYNKAANKSYLKPLYQKQLAKRKTCHPINRNNLKIVKEFHREALNEDDNEYLAYRYCVDHYYDYYIENARAISHKDSEKIKDTKAVVVISFRNSNICMVKERISNTPHKIAVANDVYNRSIKTVYTVEQYKDIDFPETIYNMDARVFYNQTSDDIIAQFNKNGYTVVKSPSKLLELYAKEQGLLADQVKKENVRDNFYNIYLDVANKYAFIHPVSHLNSDLHAPSVTKIYSKHLNLVSDDYDMSQLKLLHNVNENILRDQYTVYRALVDQYNDYYIINNSVPKDKQQKLAVPVTNTIVIGPKDPDDGSICYVGNFTTDRCNRLTSARDCLNSLYKENNIPADKRLRVYDLDIIVNDWDVDETIVYLSKNGGKATKNFAEFFNSLCNNSTEEKVSTSTHKLATNSNDAFNEHLINEIKNNLAKLSELNGNDYVFEQLMSMLKEYR